MGKKPTLYIVDGSSYIFRAYYAIRALSNSKGLPTNAVYGFTQMVLRLLKDEDPAYLVMVFDTDKPSFRKKKYDPYKANREIPPEDLVPQFEYIHKVTEALNIPVLAVPGYEADDIIATLVRRKLPKAANAVIVTGDKDLMQLVDERVKLLDTMKDKWTDRKGVKEKFGVGPEQVIDVQALAGDSSDNIPGVPGIGPKTAGQLIEQYQSLDNLYNHLEELKGKKLENLKKFKDQAYLSKWLVTLCDEVPLDIQFENMARTSPHEEACRKLFQELEFQRLLEEFGGRQEKLNRDHYQLVQNKKQFNALVSQLKKAKVFAFDTETSSLEISQAQLVGLSFATGPGNAFYLPLGHRNTKDQLDLEESLQELKPLLEDSKKNKYAQHFKYDAGVLARYGVEVRGLLCDTLLASYLLDPAGSHKLDSLALKFLNHKMISYDEVVDKKKRATFAEVPLEEACQYSAEDADVTFQLGEILFSKLKSEKLEKVLTEIEQPLGNVLLRMETWGVKVDVPFLKKLQKEFSSRMEMGEEKIYELAGEKFNIQSPKQLSVILFEKLNLPVIKKTKTGYSTDVGVLTQLSKKHDLPKEILDFRSLAKLKSTYVDALLNQADEQTHRVHTHYNQTIAETGRLSSTDPNLQNIPIRTEDGAKIRQAFIAEDGFTLLSADYSQIELRVLAHLSKDPVLLGAFRQKEDVHRKTAAGVFNISEDKVDSKMRASGKTINFAVIYGQTPFGLSGQLNVTQNEAKQYIDGYFARYQGVKKFRDKILQEARKNGEVRTLFGRRRYVPDINSKNFGARSLAERIAFNTVIQGTAADIIKMAMIEIDRDIQRKKYASRMLLQVHDELVFEVKDSELDGMKSLVKGHMEGVVDFEVTLEVEMGQGPDWAQAH